MRKRRFLSCLHLCALTTAFLQVHALSAEPALKLDDFESSGHSNRWSFSNGSEFPGAKGSFTCTADAAHAGSLGGKLAFDFAGGGHYVAAILSLTDGGSAPSSDWNAIQLWMKRPEGHEVGFRYTDARGQTFQKPVEFAAERWTEVTIPFSEWTGHWGGPNDGVLQGPPKSLAFTIGNGLQAAGVLLLDEVRLVKRDTTLARVSYPAYQFAPAEQWRVRADGNAGATALDGHKLVLDFSAGATAISLAVPDHVLLGNADRIHFRVRGAAPGHAVRLVLRTHFMTFVKNIGELTGAIEQDLVTDGPPGPGWEWHGGENDGKIHGPIRLGEIQIGSNGKPDKCALELRDIVVDASCPAANRCVLLADCRTDDAGNAEFVGAVRALTDQPLTGRLEWVVRDWEGAEVSRGRQALTVPSKGGTAEVRAPITRAQSASRKFLEAEFTLVLPGQETAPAQTAWVAPLEHRGDASLAPESPFGMGVYLNRYGGDARGLALMERAAQMARDAGVKWSREDFAWSRIERQRGQFDWTYYDNLVACAKRNGITVYGIVGYWSGWTKPYTEEGIADYVQFARALVSRYKNDVKQWEIWNEPNIFFWQGPRDLYADLLKRSYAAIKETDPQAQVLGLSTAGIDTKFIDRMLELNAPFDILTIHPYRRFLNDQVFIDDLKKVSDQVKLPDGRRRPVWLTEMGWATHMPHNTLRQDFAPNSLRAQAQLIVRSYLCAIVSGVDPRTFWYNFRNDGDDPIYFEHQMGILYNDFRPKPAYVTYATLTRVLKGMKLDRPLPSPPGVFAFSFKPAAGGPGEVIAAWSPAADARVEVPVAAKTAVRINAVGESTNLKPTNGKVTLLLQKGATAYVSTP